MFTTTKTRTKTKIAALGLAGTSLLVGAGGIAADSAQASYPSCTYSKDGLTGTGVCTSTDGRSFLWQLSVQCDGWAVVGGNYTKFRKSKWIAPGQTTSVSCDDTEKAVWVGGSIKGE